MSTAHIVRTALELIVIALLVMGYLHEDELINFEDKVKRYILHKLRKPKINKGGLHYGGVQNRKD